MEEFSNPEPATMAVPEEWNLRNIPPEGHRDVGGFFYRLFEDAMAERNRLSIQERWYANHQLFFGNHFTNAFGLISKKNKGKLSIGLMASNITRTVNNLTARSPIFDVNIGDGVNDDEDRIIRQKFTAWNGTEEYQIPLQKTVLSMELYGIGIEKAYFDTRFEVTKYLPVDVFSLLPCPGYYAELNDAPYLCHVHAMPIEEVRAKYGVGDDIAIDYDESYSILGEQREDQRHVSYVGGGQGTGNYGGDFVPVKPLAGTDSIRVRRCLVVEVWIRDYSSYSGDIPDLDADNLDLYELKYPGAIRVVTFTNYGKLILADMSNPNVNEAMPRSKTSKTFLYDHFPFYKINAVDDMTTIYGFSKGEMVGDVNIAIDSIWSNIVYYLNMSLFPPVVIPKDTKIPVSQFRYKPRLILEPVSTAVSSGLKWLQLPTPPSWLFQALDTLVKFFDRLSGLDQIDTNGTEGGVVAASALELLQERSSIMVQGEIRAVDYLVRQRGRCAISNYSNFGLSEEIIEVKGEKRSVRGIDMCGKDIQYIVESGSTISKSNIQAKAQAIQLFQLGMIDAPAALEVLQFPNWQEVVRRQSLNQLDAALQVLQRAGLPPESCLMLKQAILQLANQPPLDEQGAVQYMNDNPDPNDPTPPGGQGGPQDGQGQPSPGQGNQNPAQGAAPATGSPGGAVGSLGGAPGAPAKPGVPKAFQGMGQ